MTDLGILRKIEKSGSKTAATISDAFEVCRAIAVKDKEFAQKRVQMYDTAINRLLRDENTPPKEKIAFRDLLKKICLFLAPDFLDYYIRYIEFEREPEKRFYLPRRSVLYPLVQDMQNLVDDKLDLLAISLPPGTGKTTLEIFLHSWLVGKAPEKPNLASGHSGTLTNSLYDGVCAILFDKTEYAWADVFPTAGEIITNAKEQTIDIGKKHRFSSLTCRAIGATLTGATRCEGLLSADDLVSGIEEALSKGRLDKLWEAYTNDLKSRKKLGAKELHLSTRWSVHDVIGRLERQYEGDSRAKFVVIPALDENGESNFNYQYGVGFDTKFFMDMKANLDDASFKALYMNEPIEREGQLYHPDELRRYFELPDREPDAVIGICDTKDKGTDYCFLPVGYVYGNDHYIGDCVYDNGLPDVVDSRLIDVLLRNKVKMCRFESNAAGGRVAKDVQAGVKARDGIAKITTKYTTTNKETRIIVNSSWVKEHCLFKDVSCYERGSEYGRMMNALCSYSVAGRNKNDDVPDGMAMYADYAQSFMSGRIEVVARPF